MPPAIRYDIIIVSIVAVPEVLPMAVTPEYRRRRRAGFLAQGLCGECGRPSRQERTLCQPCADRIAAGNRRYLRRLTDARNAER